jgi:glycosyltransferase involved in cell wall biosynthesis
MKRLRILHVAPFYAAPEGGGMARASAALCRSLARRGHEVTVLAPWDGARSDEGDSGVRVLRVRGPEWLRRRLVPFGRGIGSLLRPWTFDVAHLHGVRSGLVAQAAAALAALGTPWVVQPHGTYPHHGQWPRAKAIFDALMGWRVMSQARAVLALSAAEKADLPRPAVVVGSGVEIPAEVAAPPSRARDLLVFVGSDAPHKRAGVLAALLEGRPSARLRLIGRFGPALRRRFAPFGDRVEFPGLLDGAALAHGVAEAAVLVHPAAGEAFGLVPFEAALLGTPAVVVDGHGCGEWFRRAGGCVVAAGRESALAAAVQARLDDPPLGAAEASAVASFTRRELTWDGVAARVEALYERALDERGSEATAPSDASRAHVAAR